MRLQCVIIDDEPLARECIANYIAEVDFLQLAGTGSNPVELSHLLDEYKIDLVFLDIQTPIINGIEYIKMTPNLPMIVITTAYPSYALEGFQLDVMDYLVKPITFNLFFTAVNKAKEYHQLVSLSNSTAVNNSAYRPDYFFIKCDYKFEKIYFRDILYIEALQNYIAIYTIKGKYVTLLSMKHVEHNLDMNSFIRVHKSYIVSIPRIETIENNEIVIQSFRVPLSRNYRDAVIEKVVKNNLWMK